MPVKKKIIGNAVRVSAKPEAKKTVKRSVLKKSSLVRAKKTVSQETRTPKKQWHLGIHLLIAGSAIAVLMLLGIVDRVTFSTLRGDAAETLPATIGIEHTNPLTLSIVIARKTGAGYASILNQSDETIHVSVPSDWKRSEVSGAPLSAVLQDIPVFGFTRWTLPAHAGIKMMLDESPAALFFDSTSDTTTEIDLQTIDLRDLSATSRVILLKDQALARLWDVQD